METALGQASRHKCLIYDGHPSEQLPIIVPFLIDGLRGGYRCLYLGDPAMTAMTGSALAERGVDVPAESGRGALVLTSERGQVGGRFDAEAMIAMLVKAVDDAVRDGFRGLCATGDMRWELGADENFAVLLEYEARLERVFREKPLIGICQYRRETVPGQALQDALLAHKSVYVGASLNRDNLFYMPPELLLEDRASLEKRGAWMCRQITRILEAERARDQALRALEDANRDLERRVGERTADLAAVNAELEAFSYSVSHDLRAPLRHVDGFALSLEEDFAPALGAPGREVVGRIRSGARRMAELIDSLLELARVSKAELRREAVDLGALARAAFDELQAREPGRRVTLSVTGDLGAVGDPTLLRAAIQNLLANAWKFTSKRAKARIEVGRAADEGGPVFYVSDDGAGFDMALAGKLFGAFQRLHAQGEFPGTGIGLATVRRIIARHGGRIWARASPGKGAVFSFSLP